MRVFLFASNPEDTLSLRSEDEVTELQHIFSRVSNDRAEFKPFPAIAFEEISEAIAQGKPDIVHFVAHGETDGLWVSKRGDPRKVTASALLDVIGEYKPKLIYLNACNSRDIARELIKEIKFAIGTTARIQNDVAIKGATTFYRGLLRGQSIQAAYNTARAVTRTLNETNELEMVLFVQHKENPRKEILYSTPRLIAQFQKHMFVSKNDRYNVEVGLSGAGVSTWQVVFCTDDESFIKKKRDHDLASDLCVVERTNPIKGEVWCREVWRGIEGDFRLYALAITPSGDCFSVAGTLCEALTNFYEAHLNKTTGFKFPKDLTEAINALYDNNGARLFTRKSVLEPMLGKRKRPPSEKQRVSGARMTGKKEATTDRRTKQTTIAAAGSAASIIPG